MGSSSRTTACGLPTEAVVSSIPSTDSGDPTLTSPTSVSVSSALSIRAATKRPAVSIVTSAAPDSAASQRAAIRTPLPDISAVEPSGFQIVTTAWARHAA